MSALFTVPIASTGGSIVCTNPTAGQGEQQNIYVLTFTSPKDNRLTPTFIDALILALDIIEHRYPKGVVVTTSGIAKFYSNGLDLDLAMSTEGFLDPVALEAIPPLSHVIIHSEAHLGHSASHNKLNSV